MKSLRMGRLVWGRRTLVGLISGTATSLIVLALMPHPVPNIRSHNLGHRRIQQDDNDYVVPGHHHHHHHPASSAVMTDGGEQPPSNSSKPHHHGSGDKGTHVNATAILEMGKNAGGHILLPQHSVPFGERKEQEDTGVGQVKEVMKKVPLSRRQSNLTASQARNPSQILDTRRAHDRNAFLAKAQETALTALQHGFKLTEGQRQLMKKMTPTELKDLEKRVSKVRVTQEKAYVKQLRAKKQIRPRKGGGEEIISMAQVPVRFPSTLKKIHPRDWLPQYKLFLNLTHFPWAKSPSPCSNYSIIFGFPDSLPRKALASFPSSGNTWIRYLIEVATGWFTGSLYDDTSLTKKGMYGEGIVYNSGMTILQKTHGYTTGDAMKLSHAERLGKNHMAELGYQGVIVIRNPFKALVSHRHLDIGGHTGYAPKAQFLGKGWAEFVTLKIMLWKEFYIDWLTLCQTRHIHITYYEDVKDNPVREMEEVLKYLQMPVDTTRLRCLGQHSDGLFKRRPSKNVPLDFDPFTQELKDLIYEAVDEVDGILRRSGKRGLPLHLYQFYDSHEADVARYLRRQKKTAVS